MNKLTGRCVDVAGPSTADGTAIHQWACHTGPSQQWVLEPTDSGWFRFVSRYSNKVLDVSGVNTADRARLQQWVWSNNDCQQFRLGPM